MKAELEAKIESLEAELRAARATLDRMVSTVPEQFHDMTREVFESLKAFFD